MKRAFILSLLLLSGCGQDLADLRKFVADIKATPVPFNEPEIVYPKLESVPYRVAQLRSPFVPPVRESHKEELEDKADCLRPDLNRERSALEAYALDSFTLKGIMTAHQNIWALLSAGDGKVHSVKQGDYLGLFYGQVKHIDQQSVLITEWHPDGLGCWLQKDAQLALTLEQK